MQRLGRIDWAISSHTCCFVSLYPRISSLDTLSRHFPETSVGWLAGWLPSTPKQQATHHKTTILRCVFYVRTLIIVTICFRNRCHHSQQVTLLQIAMHWDNCDVDFILHQFQLNKLFHSAFPHYTQVTRATSGSSDIGHPQGVLFSKPRETQDAISASHSQHAIQQHRHKARVTILRSSLCSSLHWAEEKITKAV